MAEHDDHPVDAPLTEVEITVAGHTIVVKAPAPLDEVAAQALGLYEQTKGSARRIPMGFDVGGGQVERAAQTDYTGLTEDWGDEDARLGRINP